MAETLLRVSELRTSYIALSRPRVVRAVDGVSFSIDRGESLGVVGESGSGKTTTCLSIVGLLPNGARIESGSIQFDGQELTGLSADRLNDVRGKRIAMIL